MATQPTAPRPSGPGGDRPAGGGRPGGPPRREGGPGGRREGGPGGRRGFSRRRKVCKFCVEKIDDINYKDVRTLQAFIAERGKITVGQSAQLATQAGKLDEEAVGPFKVLILLEIAWIMYFAVLVVVMQMAGDNADAALMRDGLIKAAFHAGSPYAVLSAIEHGPGTVAWAPFFWVLFAVFTDLFSTMDVWVYVADHTATDPRLPALKGVVLMALVLSALAAVWYAVVLLWQTTAAATAAIAVLISVLSIFAATFIGAVFILVLIVWFTWPRKDRDRPDDGNHEKK